MNGYINNLTTRINESLVDGIDPSDGILEAAMFYALSVKGKRLRPLLFLTFIDAYEKTQLIISILLALSSVSIPIP